MGENLARAKGISLIEVMILVLVVGLSVLGLLTSFVMGRIHTAIAKHKIQAVNILRARLELLKSRGYAYLNEFQPNPAVEEDVVLDSGHDGASPEDDLTCTRTTEVTDSDGDGVLEVTVTATWHDRSASVQEAFSESLFTLVSPAKTRDR